MITKHVLKNKFKDQTFDTMLGLLGVSTGSGALVEGFLKEDNSTKILKDTRGGEKEFTKSTSVGFNILDTDAS